MPKKTVSPNPETKTRKPKVFAPEIVEARKKCAGLLEACKLECKQVMASARQEATVRRLTDAMTPEQREALKKLL